MPGASMVTQRDRLQVMHVSDLEQPPCSKNRSNATQGWTQEAMGNLGTSPVSSVVEEDSLSESLGQNLSRTNHITRPGGAQLVRARTNRYAGSRCRMTHEAETVDYGKSYHDRLGRCLPRRSCGRLGRQRPRRSLGNCQVYSHSFWELWEFSSKQYKCKIVSTFGHCLL
jgi:hypothetical protein